MSRERSVSRNLGGGLKYGEWVTNEKVKGKFEEERKRVKE